MLRLEAALLAPDPDARREAVNQAAELLREHPSAPESAQLVGLLHRVGADPSWEVRNALAAAIGTLRHPSFDQILVELCRDDHGYVRRTADGALRQRSRLSRTARQNEEHIEAVMARVERLSQKYSPRVAAEVRNLAEAFTAYVVPAGTHDVRSVLTALKHSLGKAERDVLEPARTASAWRAYRATTERRLATIEKIVDDMKDFASRGPLVLEPTNLSLLIGQALEDVQDRFHGDPRAARVATKVEVDASLTIDAPRNELCRALQNMVRNAFEAIEGEGTVRIEAVRAGDDHVRIRISDDGCGIPRDDLALIFLPGHSTKKGLKRYPDKTGYGLPIAQRIVDQCQGRIDVASVEGQGTTFTIVLPIRHEGEDA